MGARRRRSGGQAAVELVALVPALIVLGLLGWQLAAGAHAWLTAEGAARAAARASAVGAPAEEAARAALPGAYARDARVIVERRAGRPVTVRVRLRVRAVVPGLPSAGSVTGTAPAPPGAAPVP